MEENVAIYDALESAIVAILGSGRYDGAVTGVNRRDAWWNISVTALLEPGSEGHRS